MLYIVGTPIGNIEDTSLRVVKTLTESDIILAEDTATFDSYYNRIQGLFGILSQKKQQFVHFHKENEFEKIPWVIEQLKNDKIISLVSESGLPTISDPGGILVKYLTSTKTPYSVIPGPSAFTTALVLSGFPTKQILFLGFLPKQETKIIQIFNKIQQNKSKDINPTVVFYESPHRIESTLSIIKEILPGSEIAICREMTKKFEEVLREKASELIEKEFKGELTVVIRYSV